MDYKNEFFKKLVKITVGITSEILSDLGLRDVHQIFLAFHLLDTWYDGDSALLLKFRCGHVTFFPLPPKC